MIQDILNITEDISRREKELIDLSYTLEENLAVEFYFDNALPTEQYFETMDALKEAIKNIQQSGYNTRQKLKQKKPITLIMNKCSVY